MDEECTYFLTTLLIHPEFAASDEGRNDGRNEGRNEAVNGGMIDGLNVGIPDANTKTGTAPMGAAPVFAVIVPLQRACGWRCRASSCGAAPE